MPKFRKQPVVVLEILEILFGVARVAVAVAVVLWIVVAITRGAYLIVANVTGIVNMLE